MGLGKLLKRTAELTVAVAAGAYVYNKIKEYQEDIEVDNVQKAVVDNLKTSASARLKEVKKIYDDVSYEIRESIDDFINYEEIDKPIYESEEQSEEEEEDEEEDSEGYDIEIAGDETDSAIDEAFDVDEIPDLATEAVEPAHTYENILETAEVVKPDEEEAEAEEAAETFEDYLEAAETVVAEETEAEKEETVRTYEDIVETAEVVKADEETAEAEEAAETYEDYLEAAETVSIDEEASGIEISSIPEIDESAKRVKSPEDNLPVYEVPDDLDEMVESKIPEVNSDYYNDRYHGADDRDGLNSEKKHYVESISNFFPYVSSSLIDNVYEQKDAIANSYPAGSRVRLFHLLKFSSEADLNSFIQIADKHNYRSEIVNDGLKVEVSNEMKVKEGALLTDIYVVANQAGILNGEYESFSIEELG